MNETGNTLRESLAKNSVISRILDLAPVLNLSEWYLGAGCVAQTVWNEMHGFAPTAKIKDYDLVYYDASDLSYEAEGSYVKEGEKLFSSFGVKVEIRNQARVHLWYPQHFGKALEYFDSSGKAKSAYKSVEDAISTWPTTATSIGVKFDEEKKFKVYAPFGLNDLLNMIVRPNKRGVPREVYMEKATRWKSLWPRLKVVPWEYPSG